MWAGLDEQREQIGQAGLDLAPGELLAAATGRGARLEEITSVLLLTDEDDFNALASVLLADCVDGRVYRLAPPQHSHGVVAPYTGGEILFGDGMTRPILSDRYHDGARIAAQRADGVLPGGHDILFLVRADGQLTAVTQADTPVPQAGDTIVSLGRCRWLNRRMADPFQVPAASFDLLELTDKRPGAQGTQERPSMNSPQSRSGCRGAISSGVVAIMGRGRRCAHAGADCAHAGGAHGLEVVERN